MLFTDERTQFLHPTCLPRLWLQPAVTILATPVCQHL